MSKIFKYTVPLLPDKQVVDMPLGALIRHVGMQNHRLRIWAEILEETAEGPRYFQVIGTGGEAPEGCYLGTVQDDLWIWHVYEVPS